MHIIKTSETLIKHLNALRESNLKVTTGLVPTMGALHTGHASLIKASVKENDITVCSIFVNPTQFGEAADLETYPKPIENDIELLIDNGCDILFLPDYKEIYPDTYQQQEFAIDGLDHKIEGASRPGHFQGVCNVLHRFFILVCPSGAYFGQKDFQQTVVAKKLVAITNSPVEIRVIPIYREPHGLAMSSRNIRLSTKGRQNAAFIYRAISQAKEDVNEMELHEAIAKATQFINAQKGAHIDYLLAVDTTTLDEAQTLESANEIALLTVVEYEGVRLLDNIYLKNKA
ncbi:pantoate--beta-alanine ligase [Bacteroidia bacterium]|jgi:pantoate--beta-alanine ligase|nr:pantoate--beta-alanine ligase [Bacteroidia bacterium]